MDKPNLYESQLFLDDTWVADSIRVGRVWHPARKRVDPVLRPEKPWEDRMALAYGTVLYHEGRFKLWYVIWVLPHTRVCYAESDDGVRWVKPELGVCEYEGGTANNIVLSPQEGYVSSVNVIDDPDDGEWPLKMIYFNGVADDSKKTGLAAARSKDGVHWDTSLGVVLPGWGDRHHAMCHRDNGKYVVFTKHPKLAETYDARVTFRTESEDLIHWSEPELVLKPDLEDEPHLEVYSATAFKYESMYLGFIERYHGAPDVLDPELWFSHDGRAWQRSRTRPAFIERGAPGTWDCGWVNTTSNAPIRHDWQRGRYHSRAAQLMIHYSGRPHGHRPDDCLHQGAIGLASLRPDGFCSLQAKEREGWLLTHPMRWPKAELFVNADPRRDLSTHPNTGGGEVRIEVRDTRGRPIDGFTFDDCIPITRNTRASRYGDASDQVCWRQGRLMASLAGRRIRFAFRMRDAHLYSFKARRGG